MRVHDGLLWFDNDPRHAFGDKVQEAAAAYERRFHQPATICYVNPSDLPADTTSPPELAVIAEPTVLRHHFFVGAPVRATRRVRSTGRGG